MPASLLHLRLGDFEGPLDLLLELVRRQQKNILDLSLTDLADQFLAYVRQADALDVSLSMEFVEMAATLIRWKSRALLPADPDLRAKGPDPRSDLIQQLLKHGVPDFVTFTGDTVFDGNDTTQWPVFFDIEKDPLPLRLEIVELSSRDSEGQQLALGLQVSGLVLTPQERRQ